MNRMLANALSGINIIIAAVIILVSAAASYIALLQVGIGSLGIIIGLVIGVMIAVITCGFIAYISLIEQHLRKIANNIGRE